MGLAEKRLAEAIKTDSLPAFEKKLRDLSQYEIKVEVDWNSFTSYDTRPLSRLDVMFDNVEYVVKKICSDDIGKEALKEKMTTVHLINTDDFDKLKMELKDKTFFLTFQLAGESYGSLTNDQILTYLENLL